MRSAKRIWLFALFAALLLGALGSLVLRPRDPLFHGRPESVWIAGITYGMSLSDDQNREQSRRWREFGPEGLRVLSRALDKNQGRPYRKFYRWLAPKLPGFLVRLMPAPKGDSTRSTRMIVLDLLWRMGKDARAATPAVSRALADEDPGVRQIAITF